MWSEVQFLPTPKNSPSPKLLKHCTRTTLFPRRVSVSEVDRWKTLWPPQAPPLWRVPLTLPGLDPKVTKRRTWRCTLQPRGTCQPNTTKNRVLSAGRNIWQGTFCHYPKAKRERFSVEDFVPLGWHGTKTESWAGRIVEVFHDENFVHRMLK